MSDALTGNAISFPVPVWNIKIDFFGNIIFSKELKKAGYSRSPVDVVIAINQDLFPGPEGLLNAYHGFFHILHQPWVMKIAEGRAEKELCFIKRGQTALDEYPAQDLVNPEGNL